LLALIRRGELAPRENVLFVMTGGAPSLFAYRDALSRASRT
jgi:1-aminocyclopropane-1-carboxylate deaminase/D-cysteine desulfhydrase-like pyridoxal-dependent ACC family enzyme